MLGNAEPMPCQADQITIISEEDSEFIQLCILHNTLVYKSLEPATSDSRMLLMIHSLEIPLELTHLPCLNDTLSGKEL